MDLFHTYLNSLQVMNGKIDAIVFPSMGTGVYGCDTIRASTIFSQVSRHYLMDIKESSVKKIVMAIYDPSSYTKAVADMSVYLNSFRKVMKEQHIPYKEIPPPGKQNFSQQSKPPKKIKQIPKPGQWGTKPDHSFGPTSDHSGKPEHFGSQSEHFGSQSAHFGSKPKHFGSKPEHFGSKPLYSGSNPVHLGSKPGDQAQNRITNPNTSTRQRNTHQSTTTMI
eukprot:TRINITY_DN1449_c0_g1_i4.p1 TRINITY_DN1449_c0_g1~~TRINITY_DN1449_c0_g1_i4.p1  ORF type:complete len:222 (-),score=36.33 TRINITY_DN1449_c0_g1_i4:209-874(-)